MRFAIRRRVARNARLVLGNLQEKCLQLANHPGVDQQTAVAKLRLGTESYLLPCCTLRPTVAVAAMPRDYRPSHQTELRHGTATPGPMERESLYPALP